MPALVVNLGEVETVRGMFQLNFELAASAHTAAAAVTSDWLAGSPWLKPEWTVNLQQHDAAAVPGNPCGAVLFGKSSGEEKKARFEIVLECLVAA